MKNADFIIEDGVLKQYVGDDYSASVPEGVIEIGERAFEGNKKIMKVTIPDGVQVIGPQAFENCKSLNQVSIPDSCNSIGGCAFKGCSSLTTVKLPKGITELQFAVFGDCTSLYIMDFSDALIRIDKNALGLVNTCPLNEIILPDSVKYFGEGNIRICYPTNMYEHAYQKIHLGKDFETIGSQQATYCSPVSIDNCSDFNYIFDSKQSGPDSEPYNISGYASYNVIMTDFSIDEDNPNYTYEDGLLLSKDKKTLVTCMKTNVDEIIVPDSVENILGHAFANVYCGKLIIPGSVKSVQGSFVRAHIGELILSEGVTELQDQAFVKLICNSIVIPHSIKKMGLGVFLEAERIKKLKLYTGMDFPKFEIYNKVITTPFWFNRQDGGFNDLEMVELYDDDDNFIARMGLPCNGETIETNERAHFFLDWFLHYGTALKTDITPGRVSSYSSMLYKKLKKKESKVKILYGVLSMPELTEKTWSKAFLPDIEKYKKELKQLAEHYGDRHTPETIDSLLQ